MHPTILGGIATAVLAAIGVTMVVWPRWWAWFSQLGMYRERPEPSAFNLISMRISGVILAVAGIGLSVALFGWQDARDSAAPTSPGQQEGIAEATSDAEFYERCLDLRPLFDAAVIVDDAGTITNVDELEALADSHDATIRPWGDPSTTAVIVKVDGVSLFAVPSPAGADHCAELRIRLLTD